MQTKYSEEELALLRGEMTDQERLGLRGQEEWTTSFNSWLNTERPSAIREWMKDETGEMTDAEMDAEIPLTQKENQAAMELLYRVAE